MNLDIWNLQRRISNKVSTLSISEEKVFLKEILVSLVFVVKFISTSYPDQRQKTR